MEGNHLALSLFQATRDCQASAPVRKIAEKRNSLTVGPNGAVDSLSGSPHSKGGLPQPETLKAAKQMCPQWLVVALSILLPLPLLSQSICSPQNPSCTSASSVDVNTNGNAGTIQVTDSCISNLTYLPNPCKAAGVTDLAPVQWISWPTAPGGSIGWVLGGSQPWNLGFSLNTTGMPVGHYTHTVQIGVGDLPGTPYGVSGDTFKVTITLDINYPTLSYAATQGLSFSLPQGTLQKISDGYPLTIRSSSGNIFFSLTPNQPWILVEGLNGGYTTGTTPQDHKVWIDARNLTKGSYTGSLTAAAPNNTGVQSITVPLNVTVTPPVVQVQVNSVPSGLSVSVDNTTVPTPKTYSWAVGSAHTLSASNETSTGARYTFTGWSNGGTATQTITVPSTAPSPYTANFQAQFLLTASPTPTNLGSITATPASTDGYYASGTQVQLSATPNQYFQLTGWSGDLTGTTNPQTVAMSAPRNIIANFAHFAQQGAKLIGTGAIGSAYQGSSVALSADGNTLIVGGMEDNGGAGAAWVFTRSAGVWTQQGTKLVGSGAVQGAAQGAAVALSADGNTAIVGGPDYNGGIGAAWVFTRSANAWSEQSRLYLATTGNGYYGTSVALSADGNTAIVGCVAPDPGTAPLVWVRSGGSWSEQTSLGVGSQQSPGYGRAVALSADGNTAIVGNPQGNSGGGRALVFTRSQNSWSFVVLTGTGAVGAGGQGSAVALSADGGTAIVGANSDNSGAGAAWIFTLSGGVWTQQGTKIVGTGATGASSQGSGVAISGDGTAVMIGGPNDGSGSGAAWVFEQSGGAWIQLGNKITGSGGAFYGNRLVLSADGLTAAVAGDADNSKAGAVWMFTGPSSGQTTFTFGSSSATVGSGASTGSVSLSVTPAGAAWTASSSQTWLTISNPSGAGSATINYNVAANPGSQSRQATITVGSAILTLTQQGTTPATSVTVATNPSGLQFNIDGSTATAPQTFQWQPGSSHTVGVLSPQGTGATQYLYTSWSDGGTQTHSVTAPSTSPIFTATFKTQVQLTTAASPSAGGSIAVSPQSTNGFYDVGTSVVLTAVASSGYQFAGWSGDLTGAANPQTLAMSSPRSVTATFASQAVTFSFSSPSATVGAGASNGTVNLSASPANASWTAVSSASWLTVSPGSGAGSATLTYTVTANSGSQQRQATLTVGAAVFTLTQQGTAPAISVTVVTVPPGLQLTVDGSTITTPQTFQWQQGSTHTLGASSVQGNGSTRFAYSSWSDGGTQTHGVTVPSTSLTLTATFKTQFQLSTAVTPQAGGSIGVSPQSTDGFYDLGTNLVFTPTANLGYQFASWSGDLTGTTAVQSIVMLAPRNVTATFAPTGTATWSIAGQVTTTSGPIPGVTVNLTGSATLSTTTDSSGNYSFSGLAAAGTYTVTPNLAGYSFSPANAQFGNLASNQTANFGATKSASNTYSISGNITINASPFVGVTVNLSGSVARSATTDGNGHYSFLGLAAGGSYTITPSMTGYSFSPSSAPFSNLAANQTAGFNATLTAATNASPITVGQTVTGTFGATSLRSLAYPNSYAAIFQLSLASKQTVALDLNSTQFHPYIIVYDATGNHILMQVGTEESGDITFSIPLDAGTYLIELSTWEDGATGSYTGSVQSRPDLPQGCNYTITPTSGTSSSGPVLPAGGGLGGATVQTQQGCGIQVMVSADAPWLSLVDANGQNPEGVANWINGGPIYFKADPNTGGQRVGSITVWDQTLNITQQGTGTSQPGPVIPSGGIVNAASLAPSLAADTWVTVFGTNLSATTRSWALSDFNGTQMPTSLDGVSVTFNGHPGYISYVSATQINVLTPGTLAAGTAAVQVKNGIGASNSVAVTIQPYAPALFTISDSGGTAYAIATSGNDRIAPAGLLGNGVPSRAASAGDYITVYGTGLGQTNPSYPEGQSFLTPFQASTLPQATICGKPATVAYAGLIAPGEDQLNLIVPDLSGVTGPNCAVAITSGGIKSAEGVFVPVNTPVQNSNGSCTVNFSGVVTSILGSAAPAGIVVGSAYSMSAVYDPSQPSHAPPTYGEWDFLQPSTSQIVIAGQVFPMNDLQIYLNLGTPSDFYTFTASPSGSTTMSAGWTFSGPSGTVGKVVLPSDDSFISNLPAVSADFIFNTPDLSNPTDVSVSLKNASVNCGFVYIVAGAEGAQKKDAVGKQVQH
jgi:uncharacterized protein (TIGR03437 family)